MRPRIFKITGKSLYPYYNDGDFVVVSTRSSNHRNLKPGDVIVFKHAFYGALIKIIRSVDRHAEDVEVTGTHPKSVDGKTLGPVSFSNIIGKVIFNFKRRSSNQRPFNPLPRRIL